MPRVLLKVAGLPAPRPPAEQREGRVFLSDGRDVTAEFARGSDACRDRALRSRVSLAVLKAKSPSCGVNLIYDGTYSGTLTAGDGTLAARLKKEGICVVTEDAGACVSSRQENPVAIVPGRAWGTWKPTSNLVRRID